jgi:hypothetical protein
LYLYINYFIKMNGIKIGIISAGLTTLSAIGVYSLYKYLTKSSPKESKVGTPIQPLDIKTFKQVLNDIMENVILKLVVGSQILKQHEAENGKSPDSLSDKIACKYEA